MWFNSSIFVLHRLESMEVVSSTMLLCTWVCHDCLRLQFWKPATSCIGVTLKKIGTPLSCFFSSFVSCNEFTCSIEVFFVLPIARTASEEVTLELRQNVFLCSVDLWLGMLFIAKKWFEIVGLCCNPISDEIVLDIRYGNNSRMSALFWILPP